MSPSFVLQISVENSRASFFKGTYIAYSDLRLRSKLILIQYLKYFSWSTCSQATISLDFFGQIGLGQTIRLMQLIVVTGSYIMNSRRMQS